MGGGGGGGGPPAETIGATVMGGGGGGGLPAPIRDGIGGGGGVGKPGGEADGADDLDGGGGGTLAREAGGPGGLLGMGGGGGAPGRAAPGTTGAARPSSVFCRVAEDGGDAGARPPGAGAGPLLGRDFFAASPSKTSRSEPALSLIALAL